MKTLYTKILSLALILFLGTGLSFGQAYTADFTVVGGYDHATTNPPPVGPSSIDLGNYIIGYTSAPSTDASGNTFQSNGSQLESRDFGGAAFFQTDPIDISSLSDFTISGVGNTVGSDVFNGTSEQFQWEYTIDGGTPVQGPTITTDGSLNTPLGWTNIPTAGGVSLVVRFEFNINGSGDGFDMTQLVVTGGTTSTPDILLSETSLSGFDYQVGSGPSAEQLFTVQGNNLTNGIIISAPPNFEISTTSGSGFGPSVTLPQTGGSVTTTAIYIRLISGLPVGLYSGTLTATSTDATQQDMSLSGEVLPVTTIIAEQDFDAVNTWAFSSDVPFFSHQGSNTLNNVYPAADGWTGDGFFGEIDLADTDAVFSSTDFSGELLAATDLDDEGDFGGPSATLTFTQQPLTGYSNIEIRFDWETIGLDSTDELAYRVIEDGTPGALTALPKDSNGSEVIQINATTTVALELIFTLNGATDYIGIDNVVLSGILSATAYTYDNGWNTNPVGVSTSADNIEILSGTAIISGTLNGNNLTVSTGANLDLDSSSLLNLSGDINNSGTIIFRSDGNGSAQLDVFEGNVAAGGEITVERYLSNNRAFRFLSSPVTTTDFISNNWQQGTHITGAQGTVGQTSADGFDETSTGNPSMYTFNNAYVDPAPDPVNGPDQSPGYTPIPNTNATNLTAGTAYALFVRGDRTIDLTSNTNSSETTLSARGALHTGRFPASGSVPLSGEENYFSLVANPYQAKVDFDNLTRIDLRPDIVVYNPASKTFVTLTGINKIVEPGQSFWVQNVEIPTAPSLHFEEVDKDNNGTNGGVTVFNDGQTLLADLELYNDDNMRKDVVKFRFNQNFNTAVDDNDFGKLFHQGENVASFNAAMLMSVDRRAIPQANEILPLQTTQYLSSQYEFRLVTENWDDTIDVFIQDNYLNTMTQIDITQPYGFTVDSNIPASIAEDRFSVSFDNSTLGVGDNTFGADFSLYPNPTKDGLFSITTPGLSGEVNLKISNILGQVLQTQTLQAVGNKINVDAQNLSSGVYLVKLTQNNQSFTAKLIKE